MSFDFIFMLTANDATVPDARARLSQVLAGGARHIGFKDVGLPLTELKILADEIRDAGGRSRSPEGSWAIRACWRAHRTRSPIAPAR